MSMVCILWMFLSQKNSKLLSLSIANSVMNSSGVIFKQSRINLYAESHVLKSKNILFNFPS